jgi:hypothetical protein
MVFYAGAHLRGEGMTNETAMVQAVELRTEQGKLQGKVYAGRYLEIVIQGKVTVYDVRTGRRMEAAVQRITQTQSGQR